MIQIQAYFLSIIYSKSWKTDIRPYVQMNMYTQRQEIQRGQLIFAVDVPKALVARDWIVLAERFGASYIQTAAVGF